jgi:transposase-like protein
MMIPNDKTDALMPIIRNKVRLDGVVYSDNWRTCSAFDVSEFAHYRISIVSDLHTNKITFMG